MAEKYKSGDEISFDGNGSTVIDRTALVCGYHSRIVDDSAHDVLLPVIVVNVKSTDTLHSAELIRATSNL